jgi:hypothetical protein
VSDGDTLARALSRKDPSLAARAVEEASRGERSLRATADAFAQDWPAFDHVTHYAKALRYYEAVARVLCPLLDRGDAARVRCLQNLALVLATVDRPAEAERIRRDVFEELRATRPPGDDVRMRAGHEVASALRVRGEHAAADTIYAEVPMCEHLRPVREELVGSGAHVSNAGHLWSSSSGIWLWFDVVLEPEALHRRLGLDACVIETENDDPRSGPELGLYCQVHKDGVVGPHPRFVGR